MLKSRRSRLAAVLATSALSLGVAASPASAQPLVVAGGGLVNVSVTDVANNNTVTVQVPVGVAANLCDINAAVLVQEFRDTGTASCEATPDTKASNGPRS